MEENNKQQQVDKILDSLDGVERATAGPYFFTRLQQKLQHGKGTSWDVISGWISKPAIAFGSLIFVVALNIIVLVNKPKADIMEDNGDDYAIATSVVYDYQNPEIQ